MNTPTDTLGKHWNGSFIKQAWGSWRVAAVASFSVVIFGLAILLLSLFAASNPMRVRPLEATDSATPIATPAATTAALKVDYYLPYPGVLPDSPIYKIKMLRDRVKLVLARDTYKKAELELLYADKRINAAIALADGGKMNLAVTTATKAEKYLEQVTMRILKLNGEGKDVKSWLGTLQKATAKHQEYLESMVGKTSGGEKEVLDATLAKTKSWGEKIGQTLLEAK
jgi:Domain of unknown function (DUF5667)